MHEEFSDYYFVEYKRLGGKKTKKQYIKNLDIFFDETFDIFVGNPIIHETREDAGYAVIDKTNISVDEYNLIFESVDNITAYT